MTNNLGIESVLITGANAGIGKETARQLASRPGIKTIYLACRDKRKSKAMPQRLSTALQTDQPRTDRNSAYCD
jgi:NAD(P)-dependent dehydrogenase (short-subunit alcohol dehydrogenase family)